MPAPQQPSLSTAERSGTLLLSAAGLACRRGERVLFRGLDLDIAPGQVWWLRGANGRGKTSLLRLLTGLSSPEAGEVRWAGRPLKSSGSDFRDRVVYVGHANGLKDDLTVLESLRFLAQIHGRPCDPKALDDALDNLGLRSRRAAAVRTLSQGQRRRVALARLALDLTLGSTPDAHPSLWILDEPYDALDAQGITTLDSLLSAQARRSGSVVLTSHLPLSLRDPEPIQLQLDALSPARVATTSHVNTPVTA